MKFKNILFIALFAITIAACGTATEQKKTEVKDSTATQSKDGAKTDEKKPAESSSINDSPTAAVKAIVDGIVAKDETAIRGTLSEETIKFFDKAAKAQNKSFYEILTMDDEEEMRKMPEMRNEKIDGDKATLEVKEPKGEKWDTLKFVKENNSWKIALISAEDAEKMLKQMEEMKNLENMEKPGATNKDSEVPETKK